MTLNLIPEIVDIVGIPRALNVQVPFGCPLGAPNNVEQHLRVLRQALLLLAQAEGPLTLVRSEEKYQPQPRDPKEGK